MRGRLVSRKYSAFTLVELVIVITILGMVAAIAVPRVTKGTEKAAANALEATLSNVRRAIDVYFAEHGRFPGHVPGSTATSGPDFVKQMTLYSDRRGNTSKTFGDPYLFGPYLRAPFPKSPVNDLNTVHVKATRAEADPGSGVGWVAVLDTGDFGVAATDAELDDMGVVEPVKKVGVRMRGN